MDVFFIIILLILSAICSATETAFSSCSRIRLKKLADSGNKSAQNALDICGNYDKALTAILIGNNIVNIASSSLATVIFSRKFGSGGVGIATAVMTVLVLIFGEITPKSLAKENAESFAIFMAAPLKGFMFILTPFIYLFSSIRKLVSKLVGSKNDSPSVTEEELKYIIDEIEDEGVLEEQESDLVRSALDFDETSISEILVPRVNVAAVEISSSMEKIKDLFLSTKYSRLPVYEKDIDHIVGVIHQSDFFEMYVTQTWDIKKAMNEPIYITENNKISQTLKIMQREKSHMAVVIDQYGGTEGICTIEDILEELVGEIYDESDEEDTSLLRISKDTFDVSAELSVSDFLQRLHLPQKAINTEMNSMGGWIMQLLDRIPQQGEKVIFPPFDMTVKMQDEQKIQRIKIRLMETDDSKNDKN